MKTQAILKFIAPLLVLSALALLYLGASFLVNFAKTLQFHKYLSFVPLWTVKFVGAMNILTFIPFFIIGFRTLGRDAAVGNIDRLRTWSAYKYVRNPMYSGLCFTFFGIGLLFNNLPFAIMGLTWLFICYLTVRGEEKRLLKQFGPEYEQYRQQTPRFVPDFKQMAGDIKKIWNKRN